MCDEYSRQELLATELRKLIQEDLSGLIRYVQFHVSFTTFNMFLENYRGGIIITTTLEETP
jgi:hypothetical protein